MDPSLGCASGRPFVGAVGPVPAEPPHRLVGVAFNDATFRAALEAQEHAAHDGADRVRTIAGPGTGKSFTIEERVCWLLGRDIDPTSITAVSFTRASATDLQNRVRAACERKGHDHTGIAVSTLHSLALRTLKAHGALDAFYPVDPKVFDQWELRNLFDAEFGHAAGVGRIKRRAEIRTDFETFWSTGSHEPRPSQRPPDPPITEAERTSFRGFHVPRTHLYACVLPGEIVQRCVQMMEAGTLDPRELLGIDHLIVDEYQDLNPMDLRFVTGVANRGATLFIAGDDDQSLYSFRYAFPEGIQKFHEQFPGCGDHALRHCFRCTPAVLTMAETLIENNPGPGRIPKNYVSLYDDAQPRVEGGTGCWRFSDGGQEARAIALSCKRLIDVGMPPREIMVLLSNVRALAADLRAAFEQLDVPFEPPREARFKDTPAGRALLTAIRLAGRTDDFVALRTLLELRKGVGVSTADGIAVTAIDRDFIYRDLFYDALPDGPFDARQTRALVAAREIAQSLAAWSPDDTIDVRRDELHAVVREALNQEPETSWEDEAEALPAEATIGELGRYLSAEKDDEQAGILVSIILRLGGEAAADDVLPPKVRVMTMHGAKGLSARIVFIPGLEEEILPGEARRPYVGQVLEAARMLFVSITRARVGCIASFANRRVVNGRPQSQRASRFTSHLGKPFELRTDGMTEVAARAAVEASTHL
jgi:DNA helicase-2/ATP-dependent DNA helicase PcrA